MIGVSEGLDRYLSCFDERRKERGGEPNWLGSLRQAAMDRFVGQGFPTTRDEEWRFTNVAPIARTDFLPSIRSDSVSLSEAEPFFLAHSESQSWHRVVFVNGCFAPELSSIGKLPPGMKVLSLPAALEGDPLLEGHLARYAGLDHPFVSLNTALAEDLVVVVIPRNLVLPAPVHLLFLSVSRTQPIVSHPRSLVVVGENSQVQLVESYAGVGEGRYFTNAVTELVAAENAVVDHYKIQRESLHGYHMATLQIHQSRSSNVSTHTLSLGGALVRNEIGTVLDGEGAESVVNGLYAVGGDQLVDNHTRIDHAKPHCASHELFKGILDQRARAVFNGRIVVRPDAQKTDSKQTNKNLLLSEEALVNTNPQLEIYADDVKCTHGATIGQLDTEAIFYLRSRGIGLDMARNLLTYAFSQDITNRIKIGPLRAELEKILYSRLPGSESIREAV
ncbi:MAG: Fe-S cluster assembly protein SufD [Acidobacteriota bacterium]